MTLTVGQCSATQMIVQESGSSGQGGTDYIVVYLVGAGGALTEVTRDSVPTTTNSIHTFNLTAGAVYRISYFAWQGAVVEFANYTMSNTAPVSTLCSSPPCVPNWQCETPLNGYEADGCGNRRLNSVCNSSAGTVDNFKFVILIVVLVALYFMLKGGMK